MDTPILRFHRIAILLFMLAGVASGCATQPRQEASVPLYDDLGDHHFPISTNVRNAQRYFDQGIRLTYAFNHQEAIESFREAARLDPDCAMCYWGIALAHGPNINLPMAPEAVAPAVAALERAQALASSISPRERAYIDALAERYRAPAPEDRAPLDEAYAEAMGRVAESYPDDPDAATLHAEALMNLSPWNYWTEDKRPRPATRVAVTELERALDVDSNHPGACHFYIHLVEAAYPERAVPCAERLASLMPGAGHVVHMPAHIYVRVGRWEDAIRANQHAIHADESYIADRNVTGVYPAMYYPHNYHFLGFAALMAGRSEVALEASQALVTKIDVAAAREIPELQGMLPYHQLMQLSFGRYQEVLATPLLPDDLPLAHGLSQYARGMALAASGEPDLARSALAAVSQASASVDEEPGKTVVAIATHMLAGEIAARIGRLDQAREEFEAAVRLEDGLPYMEPPYWYRPPRHYLGAVLLEDGRARTAENVYRKDLERFPDNAWSLLGLGESLQAQGKEQEAQRAYARFREVSGNEQIAAIMTDY